MLLLQRIWIQSLATTWWLTTIHNSGSRGSTNLFEPLRAPSTHVVDVHTFQPKHSGNESKKKANVYGELSTIVVVHICNPRALKRQRQGGSWVHICLLLNTSTWNLLLSILTVLTIHKNMWDIWEVRCIGYLDYSNQYTMWIKMLHLKYNFTFKLKKGNVSCKLYLNRNFYCLLGGAKSCRVIRFIWREFPKSHCKHSWDVSAWDVAYQNGYDGYNIQLMFN